MGLMGPISPLLICNFTDYNAGGGKTRGGGCVAWARGKDCRSANDFFLTKRKEKWPKMH